MKISVVIPTYNSAEFLGQALESVRKYEFGEDTEWLLRAKQMNIPMIRIPEVLTHKRLHGDNLSNQPVEQRKTLVARLARESVLRMRRNPRPSQQ